MGRSAAARRLDFDDMVRIERPGRRDPSAAPTPAIVRGPRKYEAFDLRRRRAQIRARRILGLI